MTMGWLGNNSPANFKNENGDGEKEEDKKIALGAEGQSEDLVLKVNQVGEANEISENQFISYKPESGMQL